MSDHEETNGSAGTKDGTAEQDAQDQEEAQRQARATITPPDPETSDDEQEADKRAAEERDYEATKQELSGEGVEETPAKDEEA